MSIFDSLAETWDIKPRRLQQAESIYKAIIKKVAPRNKLKIIDIGSGTGLLLLHFIENAKIITAADNSEGMLSVLKEKAEKLNLKNIEYLYFDADKDRLPKSAYDLVISSVSFHHIEDTERILAETFQALKPGGKICIGDLEREDGSFHSDPNASIKHFGFDKKVFAQLMRKVGYKNVSLETIFDIAKNEKKYPVFLAFGEK